MLCQIRKYFFDALVKSATNYLNTFDSKSGRFLENGGWAVTLQDAVLAYAYLYTTEKVGRLQNHRPIFPVQPLCYRRQRRY